jgi:hypothetical protein
MPTYLKYLSRIDCLFAHKSVALLAELCQALGTASRTTIFRILRAVGYLTSYSHCGRYYTLSRIPKFDRFGLWSWRGIRFSSRGTLRATVVSLIEESAAGHTHQELQEILGLRVHDTLRLLVLHRSIGRELLGQVYLYLAVDPKKAAQQKALRRERQAVMAAAAKLDPALVIDVLVEVIHHPQEDARSVAARLSSTGREVSAERVEAIFGQYGVKKTAGSRSGNWPP